MVASLLPSLFVICLLLTLVIMVDWPVIFTLVGTSKSVLLVRSVWLQKAMENLPKVHSCWSR